MTLSVDDKLLTLTDAAKVLPPLGGRRLHPSTLWRWCRRGCRGVKLDYVRLGHRICINRESLDQFAKRLAEIDVEPRQASSLKPTRTLSQRQRAIKRAERLTSEAGI